MEIKANPASEEDKAFTHDSYGRVSVAPRLLWCSSDVFLSLDDVIIELCLIISINTLIGQRS